MNRHDGPLWRRHSNTVSSSLDRIRNSALATGSSLHALGEEAKLTRGGDESTCHT
jgi:hypothetical protein